MKRLLTTAGFLAMAWCLVLPTRTFASANDTLDVYANGSSLDAVILADTTTTGAQAHSVYKLVSLDTTYIFLGAATPKSNITITGVLDQDGRRPCIQPGVLNDGSVPATLLSMATKGTVASISNVYIVELSTANTTTGGVDFDIAADSVKLYLNNVIDEESRYLVIWYSGSWDDFFIKNCIFRNGVNAVGDWYASQVLSPNLYLPINPADTVVMDYNTFFCTNGGPGGVSYANYVEFNHNSSIFTFLGGTPGVFGSGKIDNNLFYSVISGGNSKSEFTWMDDAYQPEVASLIDYDTLSVVSDSLFDPADKANGNWRMLAEAKRNVEVNNNTYFMPAAITSFLTQWDDTSHVDSLYTPGWMNARTTQMFSDQTHWPGFHASGNIVSTQDPGFGASFADVLNGGTGYGVGLLDYITKVRNGTVTTEDWGYQKEIVSGTNWVPAWPLPEAADMMYSNTTVKNNSSDGKPEGDPYWFTGITAVKQNPAAVPAKFDLSNNYPNPFNPSTKINFTVSQDGQTSLKIYNMLGQLVMTVFDGRAVAHQNYNFNVTMDNFASGVYFYTLRNGGMSATKKMILLK